MSKIRKSIEADKKSLGNTKEALQRTKALDSLQKSRDKFRESSNLKSSFLSPSRNIVSLDESLNFYKDLVCRVDAVVLLRNYKSITLTLQNVIIQMSN